MSSKKPVSREQEVRRRGRYNDSLNDVAVCSSCGEQKLGKDFYFDKFKTKGRENRCKECLRSKLRTISGKKKVRKKPHSKARVMVRERIRSAIDAGLLVRPTECEQCGRKCKPEAHHPVSVEEITTIHQVFDIVWLCRSCHMKEHKHQFVEWGKQGAAVAAQAAD